jgi:ribosome-binding factor A
LNYVLSGESHDEILRSLIVCEVTPAPDATHLLVTVRPLILEEGLEPLLILQRLQAAAGRLRSAVAGSISRRKAPELAFRVVMTDPSDPRTEGVVP